MNVLFFITHKTLTIEHARMCIDSLKRSIDPILFDTMMIYNTHQDDIDNSDIFNLCTDIECVKNILTFPDNLYPFEKKLTYDIHSIATFCYKHYTSNDRIFLLKSDIILSKNLLNDFKKMNGVESFVLTPPFVVSKKRVNGDQLVKYSLRDVFIHSDDITFFNENEHGTIENDHRDRNIKPTDETILFISCTVKSDFSCHYLTVDCLVNIASTLNINNTWGGVNFNSVKDRWFGSTKGFTIHQYHSIESVNRKQPREGTIEQYMLS